jgi:hypothetical protein
VIVLVSIDLSVLQMVAVHRPGLVSDTLTTFVVYKSLYLLLAKPVFLILKASLVLVDVHSAEALLRGAKRS